MGKPKAPSPPDPVATAQAQTASNVETAKTTSQLAKNNIVDPYGTLTWEPDPNAPGGYRQVTALSPAEQRILEQNQGLSTGLLNTATKGLATVDNMMSTPLDTSKLNPLTTHVDTQAMGTVGDRQMLTGVDGPTRGATVGPAEQAQRAQQAEAMSRVNGGMLPSYEKMANGTGIQKDINYGSLGRLPTASDQTRQRVEDAVYARQAMRLDPQFQKESDALSTKLSNMGIPLGSRAHQQAMQEFADAKERAYSGARNDAITMGGAEQSRLISDQLAIRGAGQREIENAGTFHNAAQGQGFGQDLSAVNQRNAAAGQGLTDQIAIANQNNMAKQADFQNQFNVANQHNTAIQQNADNELSRTGFNNDVGNQFFGQGLQANAANNAAASGNNNSNLAFVAANNNAAQANNANAFANANLGNTSRAQGYAEAVDEYNRPLNTINSLRTGNQTMLPQFNLQQSGPNVAPTDIAGITNAGYQNALGQYNANAASANFLPQLAGTLGSAWLGGSRKLPTWLGG